jgi:hypothetical protein
LTGKPELTLVMPERIQYGFALLHLVFQNLSQSRSSKALVINGTSPDRCFPKKLFFVELHWDASLHALSSEWQIGRLLAENQPQAVSP